MVQKEFKYNKANYIITIGLNVESDSGNNMYLTLFGIYEYSKNWYFLKFKSQGALLWP